MLAAQMAAVHMASMTFGWPAAPQNVQNIPQQDSASNVFNKLRLGSLAAQMEASQALPIRRRAKMTFNMSTSPRVGRRSPMHQALRCRARSKREWAAVLSAGGAGFSLPDARGPAAGLPVK